jgi:hypothetical protein
MIREIIKFCSSIMDQVKIYIYKFWFQNFLFPQKIINENTAIPISQNKIVGICGSLRGRLIWTTTNLVWKIFFQKLLLLFGHQTWRHNCPKMNWFISTCSGVLNNNSEAARQDPWQLGVRSDISVDEFGKYLARCPIIVHTKFTILEQRSDILYGQGACAGHNVRYIVQMNLHSTFHVHQRHPLLSHWGPK